MHLKVGCFLHPSRLGTPRLDKLRSLERMTLGVLGDGLLADGNSIKLLASREERESCVG